MPPRGPIDMLLGRNWACEPAVEATTMTAANAVETASNPMVVKRLLKVPITTSPSQNAFRENVSLATPLWPRRVRPGRSHQAAFRPGSLRHPGPSPGRRTWSDAGSVRRYRHEVDRRTVTERLRHRTQLIICHLSVGNANLEETIGRPRA